MYDFEHFDENDDCDECHDSGVYFCSDDDCEQLEYEQFEEWYRACHGTAALFHDDGQPSDILFKCFWYLARGIFRIYSYDLASCDEHVRRPSWAVNDDIKMQNEFKHGKIEKHIQMMGGLNEKRCLYKGIVAKRQVLITPPGYVTLWARWEVGR